MCYDKFTSTVKAYGLNWLPLERLLFKNWKLDYLLLFALRIRLILVDY